MGESKDNMVSFPLPGKSPGSNSSTGWVHGVGSDSWTSKCNDAERSLAVAVLKQAWRDAVMLLVPKMKSWRENPLRLKEEAIAWICDENEDFDYWCALAGADPDRLRRRLILVLQSQGAPPRSFLPSSAARTSITSEPFQRWGPVPQTVSSPPGELVPFRRREGPLVPDGAARGK